MGPVQAPGWLPLQVLEILLITLLRMEAETTKVIEREMKEVELEIEYLRKALSLLNLK